MFKSSSGSRRGLAVLATAALVCGALAGAGVASADPDVTAGEAAAVAGFSFDRIGGADRYATSALVAEEFDAAADHVILANGGPGSFADALSANYLAGELNAPVMVTRANVTPDKVLAQLKSSGVKKISVVGGASAVSDAQVAALRGAGYVVDRVSGAAGSDRFATNAEVIKSGDAAEGGMGLVATGFDFPDALAGGPIAYNDHPLGLSSKTVIGDDVIAALKGAGVTKVLVLGGESAVGPQVLAKLTANGIASTRVSGPTRSATAVAVAEYAVANLGFTNEGVNVASGNVAGGGADALAGGPLTGKAMRPLLVTASVNNPSTELLGYLKDNTDKLTQGIIFGGKNALSLDAQAQMETATQQINREATYEALIRRSEGGVPNILANDYASMGYGTGYAMAEDNVCAIADLVITFAAERSELLGASPANVKSDSFYQLFIDRGAAEEPLEAKQASVFRGAAAGFNRYLRDTGVEAITDPACKGASWVRSIDESDLRRISRMPFFLPALSAQFLAAGPPAGSEGARARTKSDTLSTETAIARLFDEERGSNGVAIGRQASADGTGLLLANPHLSWNTPAQRMYALHQTIPGEMNMTGATTLGRIQVAFGATENVAWTATVSRASDYTFYQLKLVPGKPTHYLFDGEERPMVKEVVEVEVPDAGGGTTTAEHTFYSTHFGARLLGGPGFAWDDETAYAVRPTDPGWRGVESLNESWKATSMQEFKQIQDKYQFQGTNVMAVDSSGKTYYTDANPIPYFTDDQRAACAVPGGYDGSRSVCMWKIDPSATVDYTFGTDATPHMFRDDFVSNMNDSHWLTNPAQPLTGYDGAFGVTGTERTLRTRAGLDAINQRLAGTDGQAGKKFTLDGLQKMMFSNITYAGVILRDGMVELCANNPRVTKPDSTVTDISEVCGILKRWDLHDNLDSRGAHLFREIMAAGRGGSVLPASWNYVVPFDVKDPVNTPRGLDPKDNDAALQAIAAAVDKLRAANVDLDARLGDVQSVTRNGERIPMHGGTGGAGLFNILTAPFVASAGGYPEVASGASWIQASEFGADGLVSRGILAFSQSTNPNSPHFSDMTRMYSKKQWVDLPITESQVAADALSSTYLVENSSVCSDGAWRAGLGIDFASEATCVAYYDEMLTTRLAEYDERHD